MRTRDLLLFVLSSTTGLASLAGCGSSSSTPSDMSVTKTCVKTLCDALRDERNGACGKCLAACSSADFDCDPSESCSISCSEHDVTCGDTENNTCEQQAFVVKPSDDTNADLQAACERMFQRYAGCGESTGSMSSADCATWAKTERPERAADYDCVANLACKADESGCGPAPTSFGDDLCDAMDAQCSGICTKDIRAALNSDGPWMRDDVQKAGLSCTTQSSCGDAHDCFFAWIEAARL